MANNYKGYLFKATKSNTIFPLKYINEETWKSTPKQREEIKAYRDDNTRNLTRITADGMKSTFSFATRPNLHLDDKIAIQKFFTDNESVAKERKIQLTYWNDEDNNYATSYFYRPNMDFPIRTVSNTDIIYGELSFELIEY